MDAKQASNIICPFCGNPFTPARSDQRYCTTACRDRAGRRRWLAKRTATRAAARAERQTNALPDCFCPRGGADICPMHRPGEMTRRTLTDETFWRALKNGGR